MEWACPNRFEIKCAIKRHLKWTNQQFKNMFQSQFEMKVHILKSVNISLITINL